MNSEILVIRQPETVHEYPKVMRYKASTRQLIVMFITHNKGVVLVDTLETARVGRLEENFFSSNDPDCWEPFSGDIKLVIKNGK